MKSKIGHGGSRVGSGRKKNKRVKPANSRRTIKKMIRFSPDECLILDEAVKASGKDETKIIREGALRLAEILSNKT